MSSPSADRASESGGLGGNQGPDPGGPIGRHWIYAAASRRWKGAIKVVSRPFVSKVCSISAATRTRKPRVERGATRGLGVFRGVYCRPTGPR